MSQYYRVLPTTRYYLDPASPDGLRAVVEDGWCSIFHQLRARGDHVAMAHHIEICDDCKAYVDRCQEIALAHLAAAGLQPEGGEVIENHPVSHPGQHPQLARRKQSGPRAALTPPAGA